MQRSFHVIGPGRAAGAIAQLLCRQGWTPGRVWSRNAASIAKALARIGGGLAAEEPRSAFESGVLTLIGLPDDALRSAAEEWAPDLPHCSAVALHLSGSRSSDELAPLRARGVAVGSLHPASSFADRGLHAPSLEGVYFGIEGDPAAVDAARNIVAELGGRALVLDAASKALYHAAATVASNALVSLFDLALRLDDAAGLRREDSAPALLALARATLNNLERHGSPDSLTGPIERGDIEVVRGHLAALGALGVEERRQLEPFYRQLGQQTLVVAEAKGSLSQAQIAKLRALLDAPP